MLGLKVFFDHLCEFYTKMGTLRLNVLLFLYYLIEFFFRIPYPINAIKTVLSREISLKANCTCELTKKDSFFHLSGLIWHRHSYKSKTMIKSCVKTFDV